MEMERLKLLAIEFKCLWREKDGYGVRMKENMNEIASHIGFKKF